jgi:hypothetical protein
MTAEPTFSDASDASDACDAFSGYPPTRARVDAYTEIASHSSLASLKVAGRRNALATAEVSASHVRRARRDPPGENVPPHQLSRSSTL